MEIIEKNDAEYCKKCGSKLELSPCSGGFYCPKCLKKRLDKL